MLYRNKDFELSAFSAEDNIFVVCLMSVQNKKGKGKFMGHIWTHLVLQGNAKLLIKGRLQTYIRPIVGIF